jgi:hypothetical protein
METWIVGFCNCVEGCCDGSVIFPHAGIGIFGFLHCVEDYCGGVVACFPTGLLLCAAV